MLPDGLRMNYRDFQHLPDDGKIYEIIEGELFNAPPPSTYHQDISRNLVQALLQYLDENPLGKIYYAPIAVVLGSEDIVQPDIVYISKEKSSIITPREIKGTPNLIIEITSTKPQYDKVVKKKLYAKYRVPEYWVIDMAENVVEVNEILDIEYKNEILRSGDILRSKALPKFEISVDEIFEI
jgi:Uma2 family endonuclease